MNIRQFLDALEAAVAKHPSALPYCGGTWLRMPDGEVQCPLTFTASADLTRLYRYVHPLAGAEHLKVTPRNASRIMRASDHPLPHPILRYRLKQAIRRGLARRPRLTLSDIRHKELKR